jgi:hypothetical protein
VIRDVFMQDIKGRSISKAGQFICAPSSPCHIGLDNIDMQVVYIFGKQFLCQNAYGKAKNVKPNSCLK